MTNRIKTVLVIATLVSFVLMLGAFNTSKPRILVLHSAREGSAWADAVDRGMRRALEANRRPVSVEWNYMDATAAGRPIGPAEAEARRAIGRVEPAVLIAVDDEANLLVARDYVGRAEPRILYVSLDRPPADFGYTGAPNVSGIAERLPFAAIKDAVTDLIADPAPRLSVLGVDGVTGRAEMAQAEAFDWGPLRIVRSDLVATAQGWRDAVTAAADSDVLVVLSCQDLPDQDGTVFTAADAARWTEESSRALPIGTQSGYVDGGGGLSIGPDPGDYGGAAIRLALDWLDDRTSPGPPPPVESAHFEVAVRTAALARRGVALPPIYLEAARANGTLFERP